MIFFWKKSLLNCLFPPRCETKLPERPVSHIKSLAQASASDRAAYSECETKAKVLFTCWGFLKSKCIRVKEMWPFPSLICPFPQLLPLLLESLSCPDHVVQLSTLRCVQPLLLDAPHVMHLHIDTLVCKFLNLTDNSAMVSRVVFPFSDYFLLFYLEKA